MVLVSHLLVDWLEDGQLPLYDPWPGRSLQWYMVDEGGLTWSIIHSQKLLISVNLDVQFRSLGSRIRRCLHTLEHIHEDGSLVFPVRMSCRMEGGYHFVEGGMAFLPGMEFGQPLDGQDPANLIVEACDTELDPEDAHPIVQTFLEAKLKRHEPRETARLVSLRRARQLLTECLSEEQTAEFETGGQFHVVGADGHLYRITKGYGHNVLRIKDGVPIAEYCIIHQEMVPDYDLMLTQKLLLETAPGQFEAISNIRLLNRLNFPKRSA